MKLGLYQHYKGPFYQVIGIGRHSERLKNCNLSNVARKLWPLDQTFRNVSR